MDEAKVSLIRGDEFGLDIGSITYKMPNPKKALTKRTLTVDQASVNEISDRFFVGSEPSRTRSSVLINSLLANHCKQVADWDRSYVRLTFYTLYGSSPPIWQ